MYKYWNIYTYMYVSVYIIKFNKSIRAYLKYFLNLLLTRYSYIKSLKESTPSLVNLLHKLYAHLELRKPQKQKSGQKVPKQANASRSNPPRKSGYAKPPHWHQPAKTGGKWHKKRTKKVVAHLHLRENKGKHHCCPPNLLWWMLWCALESYTKTFILKLPDKEKKN